MGTLEQVGAPTTAQELGMDRDQLVEALMNAHTIRPSRYTILDEPIDRGKAEEILEATGVTA